MRDESDVSLVGFETPGSYSDIRGREDITWMIGPDLDPSRRPPRFAIRTSIRGVSVGGPGFDLLEPDDVVAARVAGLTRDQSNWLTECVLGGDLPSSFFVAGQLTNGVLRFELHRREREVLRLEAGIGDQTIAVEDEWFEGGMGKLAAQLPEAMELSCCATCRYSDWWFGGHGLMGMECFRASAEQYLAARTKAEWSAVPVTEFVMESHRCREWTRRRGDSG